jgi:serine/threonine protein kinase
MSTDHPNDEPTLPGGTPLRSGRVVFGRFQLEKLAGRGGMGVVWLARDQKLDRPVALKFLPEVFFLDPAARDDLKRETRRSLELTHPNIVRIHDFVDDEEMAAIAMEFVDGPTLSQLRIEQPSRCFEPSAISAWTATLCAALDYAHDTGRCVHRDLKPGNLMITSREVLKVADFGISCTLHSTATRVSTWKSTGGTLGYMSPQQLIGELAAPSDDIYAIGATLFELLTGTTPFRSGDLALQIRERIPETVSDRRRSLNLPTEGIPQVWDDTIAACLEKQPEQRPATAAEIARRLGLVSLAETEASAVWKIEVAPTLRDIPRSAAVTAPTQPAFQDTARQLVGGAKRHRWPIVAGVAGVLALLAWIPRWSSSRDLPEEQKPVTVVRTAEIPAQIRVEPASTAPASPSPSINPPAERPAEGASAVPSPAIPGVAIEPLAATSDRRALLSSDPDSAPERPVAEAAAPGPNVQVITTPPGIPFKVVAGASESPDAEAVRAGESPAVLDGLAPGAYRLVFAPPGLPARGVSIQAPQSGTNVIQQEFPHGVLKARSQPDGADIICDGKEMGEAPLEIPLLPGKHEVTARWNDKDARVRTITLAKGAEQTVNFDFRSTGATAKTRQRRPQKDDDSVFTKVGRSMKNFFTGKGGK